MGHDWKETTLGEVITLQRGFDLPTQDRQPGTVPIVSSSGISGFHREPRVHAPGVVTGRYGTIGEVFFVTEPFWPLNTTLYVKDFKGNDPRFVSYLLRTVDFLAHSDKSSVPGVNRNHLHRAIVRVPGTVDEQRAIADVLGTLDDKIQLNRRMNQTLDKLARRIFRALFVDFDVVRANASGKDTEWSATFRQLFPSRFQTTRLGLTPAGWSVGSILERATLLSGGTPKTIRKDYWNGDTLWASAKDISQVDDPILIKTERTITQKGLNESATQLIPAWCTVVVARGATTGRMALLGREMAMNQTCYALASKIDTPLALYCQLMHEIERLVHGAHGSVFDTITTSTFAASMVLLAPEAALKAFEFMVSPLFQAILSNIEESVVLSDLRNILLPKLLSGHGRIKQAEEMLGTIA